MNFTYVFGEDPVKEPIQGNLTWLIPNFDVPAHWIHTEDICKLCFFLQNLLQNLQTLLMVT